jgi:hypothetical protein
MTTINHQIQISGVCQNVRDRNARQLRSEFLASLFKAFCDTVRKRFAHSLSVVRVNTQA